MDKHPLSHTLCLAREAGLTFRLLEGQIEVSGEIEPEARLLAELKRSKDDITILCRAANDLSLSLIYCADQLGEADTPSELGYAGIHHFLQLCVARDATGMQTSK